MIVEIAAMTVHPEQMREFESVFPKAAALVSSIPGYLSHEMWRCVETKGEYCFVIRWENIDAHLVNFRQSPKVGEFRALLGPFFAAPTTVKHFDRVTDSVL